MKKETKTVEETDEEAAPLDRGVGEQMRVTLSGSADKVSKRLSLPAGEPAGVKPPEDPNAPGKFFTALKERKDLIAVVTRTQPREFNGEDCRLEVDRFPLPENWQSIKDQVAEAHGGKKYRVALMDPQTGRTIDAENFEVPGDPILMDVQEMVPNFEDEPPPDPTPLEEVENAVRKEIKSATTEAELISARRRVSILRKGHGEDGDTGNDPKVQNLERQIQDIERRNELKAIEDRHQRELADLKRQIEAKPASNGSDRMIELMLQQSKDNMAMVLAQQKSSDEKFSTMMKAMQDQKLDAITASIRDLSHKKEDSGFEKQLEMFKSFADLMGVPLGGGKDDDDKPWYETLAEESLPRILDMMEGKRKDGKTVTKEDLIKEIEKETDRLIAEKAASGQLPSPGRPQAGRPAVPRALPPAAPPAAGQLPPPPPSLDLPPPPGGAAPVEPLAQLPTVEEERKVRCANVMVILERELMFRPKEFQWNFVAWQNLPEDALERFVASVDLPTAISTFEGTLNPEGLTKMKTMVTIDDRVKAWCARGFKELQGWWQESLKNPDFDPADDGEEGEDGDDV